MRRKQLAQCHGPLTGETDVPIDHFSLLFGVPDCAAKPTPTTTATKSHPPHNAVDEGLRRARMICCGGRCGRLVGVVRTSPNWLLSDGFAAETVVLRNDSTH